MVSTVKTVFTIIIIYINSHSQNENKNTGDGSLCSIRGMVAVLQVRCFLGIYTLYLALSLSAELVIRKRLNHISVGYRSQLFVKVVVIYEIIDVGVGLTESIGRTCRLSLFVVQRRYCYVSAYV